MTQSVAPRITREVADGRGPNRIYVDFIRDPETTYGHDDYVVIARLEAQKAGYTLIGGYLYSQVGEQITVTFTEKRARR